MAEKKKKLPDADLETTDADLETTENSEKLNRLVKFAKENLAENKRVSNSLKKDPSGEDLATILCLDKSIMFKYARGLIRPVMMKQQNAGFEAIRKARAESDEAFLKMREAERAKAAGKSKKGGNE